MNDKTKRAKDHWDSATKNLSKMAGSGPLGARRGNEKKYVESFHAYMVALREEGIADGYMFPKKKYLG